MSDYELINKPVPILCDNTSAFTISKNHVQHARNKHIEIRHHFLRDCVEKKLVSMDFNRTNDQIANTFTRDLNRKPFESFRHDLGMISLN